MKKPLGSCSTAISAALSLPLPHPCKHVPGSQLPCGNLGTTEIWRFICFGEKTSLDTYLPSFQHSVLTAMEGMSLNVGDDIMRMKRIQPTCFYDECWLPSTQTCSANGWAADICPVNHLLQAVISNPNDNFILKVKETIASFYSIANYSNKSHF